MWRLALVCCALCVGCDSTALYTEKTPEWFGADPDTSHTTSPTPPTTGPATPPVQAVATPTG